MILLAYLNIWFSGATFVSAAVSWLHHDNPGKAAWFLFLSVWCGVAAYLVL